MDDIILSLRPEAMRAVSGLLALTMLGVGLSTHMSSFTNLSHNLKKVCVGLGAQSFGLPMVTFLLTIILDLPASIALGMIVVSACPGSLMSNWMTKWAKGDEGLSSSLTSYAYALSCILLPLHIVFWSSLNPSTAALLSQIDFQRSGFLLTVIPMMAGPFAVGLAISHFMPDLTGTFRLPVRVATTGLLVFFVASAVYSNSGQFLSHLSLIGPITILHNALALALGWVVGVISGVGTPERRTYAIEVGVQNAGIGLVLLLTFFDGLGGAALVTITWAGWFVISGSLLSLFWHYTAGSDRAT